MSLSVLLVSEPGADGVLRHVEGLGDYLLSQGVRVHLAWSDRKTSDRLYQFIERVRAAGGETVNLATGNTPGFSDLGALARLRNLAARARPEVIHAHSSKGGALARMLPFLGVRARYFYTPHAYYKMDGGGGSKAAVFQGVEKALGRIGTTINLSQDEAAFARERIGVTPKRQLILPNGVDTQRMAPCGPERRRELRIERGLPAEGFLAGTVARLTAQKDPVTLYRALAQTPELAFAHLGDGELTPELAAAMQARAAVAPTARVPYMADPAPFYAMLDAFVLPSRYEGMAYAVLEAMAFNLPLVLTRCPGNRDFGTLGLSHVFWAKPGDAESVAEALRACRAAWERGETPNHREIATARFSREKCFGDVLAAYGAAKT